MNADSAARALGRIEGTSFRHRCNSEMRTELVSFALSDIGFLLLPRTRYALVSVKCRKCPLFAVFIEETRDWRVLSDRSLR